VAMSDHGQEFQGLDRNHILHRAESEGNEACIISPSTIHCEIMRVESY